VPDHREKHGDTKTDGGSGADSLRLGHDLFARHATFPERDLIGPSIARRFVLFGSAAGNFILSRWALAPGVWGSLNPEWLHSRFSKPKHVNRAAAVGSVRLSQSPVVHPDIANISSKVPTVTMADSAPVVSGRGAFPQVTPSLEAQNSPLARSLATPGLPATSHTDPSIQPEMQLATAKQGTPLTMARPIFQRPQIQRFSPDGKRSHSGVGSMAHRTVQSPGQRTESVSQVRSAAESLAGSDGEPRLPASSEVTDHSQQSMYTTVEAAALTTIERAGAPTAGGASAEAVRSGVSTTSHASQHQPSTTISDLADEKNLQLQRSAAEDSIADSASAKASEISDSGVEAEPSPIVTNQNQAISPLVNKTHVALVLRQSSGAVQRGPENNPAILGPAFTPASGATIANPVLNSSSTKSADAAYPLSIAARAEDSCRVGSESPLPVNDQKTGAAKAVLAMSTIHRLALPLVQRAGGLGETLLNRNRELLIANRGWIGSSSTSAANTRPLIQFAAPSEPSVHRQSGQHSPAELSSVSAVGRNAEGGTGYAVAEMQSARKTQSGVESLQSGVARTRQEMMTVVHRTEANELGKIASVHAGETARPASSDVNRSTQGLGTLPDTRLDATVTRVLRKSEATPDATPLPAMEPTQAARKEITGVAQDATLSAPPELSARATDIAPVKMSRTHRASTPSDVFRFEQSDKPAPDVSVSKHSVRSAGADGDAGVTLQASHDLRQATVSAASAGGITLSREAASTDNDISVVVESPQRSMHLDKVFASDGAAAPLTTLSPVGLHASRRPERPGSRSPMTDVLPLVSRNVRSRPDDVTNSHVLQTRGSLLRSRHTATAGLAALTMTHRPVQVIPASVQRWPDLSAVSSGNGPSSAAPSSSATAKTLPDVSSAREMMKASPGSSVDVTQLANRVYDILVRRLASERQRRGS